MVRTPPPFPEDVHGLQQSEELEDLHMASALSAKGICCECVSYHLRNRELPGCCFPVAAERTYDRSFAHLAR